MTEKRNEAYWALKTRLDKWGTKVTLLIPLIVLPTLGFVGAFIGNKLPFPEGFLIGFLVGGMIAQAICLTIWKRKLGFVMYSKECCPSCGASLAQWHLRSIRLSPICPNCGNDNRIDLHDT